MTDWSEVRKGWVVRGGGAEWTVLEAKPPIFTISSPGRDTWRGERKGPVDVVSRPAPQADPEVDVAVAKGLLVTKFGGIEIGKRDKAGRWMTPVEFEEPGSMLAHLRIFHAAMSDEPSLAGLRKFHGTLHGPEHKAADFYEPHVHDPDYLER